MMQKLFSEGISQLLRLSMAMIMMIGLITEIYASDAIAASLGDNQTTSNLGTPKVTVYRSPSCSCCGNWLEHIKQQGFQIQADIKTDDMDAIKEKHNLPQQLASCHTAIIDGYVMEGHIPANDMKHFLKQQPQLAGLAVPGMITGTPGMESGNTKDPFNVMAFDHKGEVQVFQQY